MNDDASVRSLEKGAERPINPEQARAAIISSLRAVDAAVIFGESTPLKLIEYFHQDILVKGGDYHPEDTNEDSPKYMVGSRELRSWGGSVAIIPTVQVYSTTASVSKLTP